MAVAAKHKVGRLYPTQAEGVYRRLRADGKYTFYARRADGKRNFEACDSFEAAKAPRADFTGKNIKGEVIGSPATTLAQVIEQWRATRTHVKPRTRVTEETHIRLHFDPLLRCRVRDINRAKVVGWLAGLTRQDGKPGPMSDGTKATVLATLSSVLDHAVLADIISVNPCKTLGRKQKPRQGKCDYRVLTAEELDAILAGVGRQKWMALVIRFSVLTGLRLGEVAGLEWQDVDFQAGTITVSRQLGKDGKMGTPKGGVTATMPMIGGVRSLLAETRLQAGPVGPESPVFPNSLGQHRQPRDIQRGFGWAKDRAGIEGDLRFHDLRHTCASLLANAPGAELPQVQAYMRHASLNTTLGYVHKVERAEWADQADTAFAGFGT
jgi:integrase